MDQSIQQELLDKVAEDTDNYWRQNIFVSALAEGRHEVEAARLAQNVLLDYGDISKVERQIASNFVLFYAFQRQMSYEVIKELLRGGNRLRQLAVLHRYQHEQAKTWAFSKDYEKTRTYAHMGPVFDRVAKSGIYGPGNPGLEAFNMMANVFGWMMGVNTGGRIQSAKKGLTEWAFTPEIRFFKDIVDYGPDSKTAGYVPPHQVVALMEAGVWDLFRTGFEVTQIQTERRRPGEPDFHGFQFTFSKDGYNKYLKFVWLMTRLGMMRTIDDVTKQAIAAGLAPEGAELKRLGTANPILVAGNIQTPMQVSDEETVRYRNFEKIERELLAMSREVSP